MLHVHTGLGCVDPLEPLELAVKWSKDDRPVADLLTLHQADLGLLAQSSDESIVIACPGALLPVTDIGDRIGHC